MTGATPVPSMGIVPAGYQFARWDTRAFRPGNQILEYQFNGPKGRLLGPFRVPVVKFGKESFMWRDAFGGPDLGLDWKGETQAAGPTIKAEKGLVITVPGDKPYDLWAGVLDGPRVLHKTPGGDWSYTVTMPFLDRFGDWQTGLCVALRPGAFALFGPFQRNSITLEATGRNALASFPLPAAGKQIELRARKTANMLWFDWRVVGGVWSTPAPLDIDVAPGHVGVFAKTWQAAGITATFTETKMAALK